MYRTDDIDKESIKRTVLIDRIKTEVPHFDSTGHTVASLESLACTLHNNTNALYQAALSPAARPTADAGDDPIAAAQKRSNDAGRDAYKASGNRESILAGKGELPAAPVTASAASDDPIAAARARNHAAGASAWKTPA